MFQRFSLLLKVACIWAFLKKSKLPHVFGRFLKGVKIDSKNELKYRSTAIFSLKQMLKSKHSILGLALFGEGGTCAK